MKLEITKLYNTNMDCRVFEFFDRKLAEYERQLDNRLLPDKEIKYNNIPKVLGSKNNCVFVASIGNEKVGYVVGKIHKDESWYGGIKYGYIENLFVDESFRKKGIATALLETMKGWFVSQGIIRIKLRVFTNNTGAIKLYQKHAFQFHVSEMICDNDTNVGM